LGVFLASQKHEVITLSTKPGSPSVEQLPSTHRRLFQQRSLPGIFERRWRSDHFFMSSCARALIQLKPDVVHSLHYTDAFASAWTKRLSGHLRVMQMNGPPIPSLLSPRLPPDRWFFREAARRADVRIVISNFCSTLLEENYGLSATVLPIPVDLDAFVAKRSPVQGAPTFLSVASFDDRRKGARTLVRAFSLLADEQADTRLVLSGQASEEVRKELRSLLPARHLHRLQILGTGQLSDLPWLYRQANVLVLPSMWEAFGMVLIEAWASGTPVVATRHGGCADLVNDPSLGRLFDPLTDGMETTNVEGLAEAMRQSLKLAEDPQTIGHCRRRAEEFGWEQVGPKYESLYGLK
jgi:phosphatidylinositol alpha-mannosyltransferase